MAANCPNCREGVVTKTYVIHLVGNLGVDLLSGHLFVDSATSIGNLLVRAGGEVVAGLLGSRVKDYESVRNIRTRMKVIISDLLLSTGSCFCWPGAAAVLPELPEARFLSLSMLMVVVYV